MSGQSAAAAGSKRPTVLIVDDEPTIRLLVRATLEEAGYRSIEAADGRDALELARSERPDAVLLDIAIPHVSGLDVCRQLRQRPETAGTPVLFLTGLGHAEEQQAAGEAGGQGCIFKPFQPADLVSRLAEALR